MNLNTLDLNLLKAFDALYRERHVGRAGASIGLAQPSMSNALNRLRAQFDDQLFLRGPDGMTPTAKAEAMAPQVQDALASIVRLLAPVEFDPRTIEADVSIAAADLIIINIAPHLMTYLHEAAPNVRVSFVPLDKRMMEQDLDDGSVTLAIGTFGRLPARFLRKTVLQDHFICITRQGLFNEGERLTLENYIKGQHALMTLSGDFTGAVDQALKRLGYCRRVVMTSTQMTLLPDIIARSDLIATIPAALAPFAQRAGCCIFQPPLELTNWDIDLIQTQRSAAEPLGSFLSGIVQSILEKHLKAFPPIIR